VGWVYRRIIFEKENINKTSEIRTKLERNKNKKKYKIEIESK
jgi:hypothetical protein